jgi:hypothetical protein
MSKLSRRPTAETCDSCSKTRLCHQYALKGGDTAFICYDCRYGDRLGSKRITKSELIIQRQIKVYNDARNKALLKGPNAMLQFMRDHKIPVPIEQHTLLLTYHKTVTGVVSLPMELRKKSKAWLNAHKSKSWDDGDLG